MLCEQCKTREATIVIREVINGVATEHHLCGQCASATELGMLFDGDSSFARLLSGILGLNVPNEKVQDEKAESLTCPCCHTTFGDFVKNGRFGCPECYETFGLLIYDNIKKLQGNDTHTGKRPKYFGVGKEHSQIVDEVKQEESLAERLEILTARQKEAVADEDYEAAAKYRDEIRSLKERMDNHEVV